MESGDVLSITRMLLAGMMFLLGVGFTMPVQAESGSSQAILSLFVPPNDTNMMAVKAPTPQNASMFNRYDDDTSISLTQQSEGVTYKVWVAI